MVRNPENSNNEPLSLRPPPFRKPINMPRRRKRALVDTEEIIPIITAVIHEDLSTDPNPLPEDAPNHILVKISDTYKTTPRICS